MQALEQEMTDVVIEKELGRLYAEAIQKLPPQKRAIYTLHRNEGLSYEEIAIQLGLSKNTVRNHMSAAIHSVQDYVSTHHDLAVLVIAICLLEQKNNYLHWYLFRYGLYLSLMELREQYQKWLSGQLPQEKFESFLEALELEEVEAMQLFAETWQDLEITERELSLIREKR